MTICIFCLTHHSHTALRPPKNLVPNIFAKEHIPFQPGGVTHSTKHTAPMGLVNINSQAKKELLEGDGRCLSPTACLLGKSPFAPGGTFLQFLDSPPVTHCSGQVQHSWKNPATPQTFLSNPEHGKFLHNSEWDVSIMFIVLVQKIHWFSVLAVNKFLSILKQGQLFILFCLALKMELKVT